MSCQLLARAWAAGAGAGDSPLTIDLASTICETYGMAKEGARPSATDPTCPPTRASPVREHLWPCPLPAIPLTTATVGPPKRLQTAAPTPHLLEFEP